MCSGSRGNLPQSATSHLPATRQVAKLALNGGTSLWARRAPEALTYPCSSPSPSPADFGELSRAARPLAEGEVTDTGHGPRIALHLSRSSGGGRSRHAGTGRGPTCRYTFLPLPRLRTSASSVEPLELSSGGRGDEISSHGLRSALHLSRSYLLGSCDAGKSASPGLAPGEPRLDCYQPWPPIDSSPGLVPGEETTAAVGDSAYPPEQGSQSLRDFCNAKNLTTVTAAAYVDVRFVPPS